MFGKPDSVCGIGGLTVCGYNDNPLPNNVSYENRRDFYQFRHRPGANQSNKVMQSKLLVSHDHPAPG